MDHKQRERNIANVENRHGYKQRVERLRASRTRDLDASWRRIANHGSTGREARLDRRKTSRPRMSTRSTSQCGLLRIYSESPLFNRGVRHRCLRTGCVTLLASHRTAPQLDSINKSRTRTWETSSGRSRATFTHVCLQFHAHFSASAARAGRWQETSANLVKDIRKIIEPFGKEHIGGPMGESGEASPF